MKAVAEGESADALRNWGVLIGVFLLLLLPFQDGAFSIDDGTFVDQASQILRNPAAPYSFEIRLSKVQSFYTYMASPPGQAFFLSLPMRLFGHSELALHLACIPLAWLAIWGMFRLSREMTGRGLLAALLLVSAPAFVMSAKTVMADVPTAAFYLLAILWLVRGVDSRHLGGLVTSGAMGALAILFKYSAITLIPLMLLYPILRRRLEARNLIPAGIALAVLLIWCAISRALYGEVHLFAAGDIQVMAKSPFEQGRQLMAVLLHLGGSLLFPPVLIAWAWMASARLGRRSGWSVGIATAAAALIGVPAIRQFEPSYGLGNRLLAALLLSAGVSLLGYMIALGLRAAKDLHSSWSADDEKQRHAARIMLLIAWFCGLAALDVELLFSTPKYLVPALAPALLLLLMAPHGMPAVIANRPPWEKGVAIASTAALAFAIASVDSSVAGFTRDAVKQAARLEDDGARVWFNQHWTLRYYAEQHGFRYLGAQLDPADYPALRDSYVYVTEIPDHPIPDAVRSGLAMVFSESHTAPFPIHVSSFSQHAGYWSHAIGTLPYVFASDPHATAIFFRIRRDP